MLQSLGTRSRGENGQIYLIIACVLCLAQRFMEQQEENIKRWH